MLSGYQDERLVRTDPGTEMGTLLRRYWIPALLSEEVAEPDCDPVRVQLLGEELIAFRDSTGRLGLLDELCSHQAVSLFFGRNGGCGLRCAYHGWKYDVEGNCIDMPSEPPGSRRKEKIKHISYPCVERGGVVWAYLGPAKLIPEPPELEWATLPSSQVFVSKRIQESNYLQAMEAGFDSSQVSFAHWFDIDNSPMHAGTDGLASPQPDIGPKFEVIESDGGLLVGARHSVDADNYYWRIAQWIMPWYTIIPPFGTHKPLGASAWVPIDDEHCWTWSINYHPTRDLRPEELDSMRRGEGIHPEYVPGTYHTRADKTNNYLIDRAAQRADCTFSVVHGIAAQDFSPRDSMGAIVDRSIERLGTSGAAITLARRRLLSATADAAAGRPVPGDQVAHQRVRSALALLPKSIPFSEGAAHALLVRHREKFASI